MKTEQNANTPSVDASTATTSTALIVAPVAPTEEILASKGAAWAAYGENLTNEEYTLQLMAHKAVSTLTDPTSVEQIPQAENALKILSAAHSAISEKRKEITRVFDELTTRLMEPEKSVKERGEKLKGAVIALKRVLEEQNAAKSRQDQLLKDYRELCQRKKAEWVLGFKTNSARIISSMYQELLALGATVDQANAAVTEKIAKVKAVAKPVIAPPATALAIEQSTQISSQELNIDVEFSTLLDAFANDLTRQFADYAVALTNKNEAIQKAQSEEAAKKAKAEEEKRNSDTAAKITAQSQALVPEQTVATKNLKRGYEVDMPETLESAVAIMGAFVANVDKCLPHLRVAKWMSLTVKQMANPLGKVKSEDEHFQPVGIVFKETEKL
jgi:hypothetical protein